VALHDAAPCYFHLDPGFLNGVGVFDRYAGMFERKLPDLRARFLGLIESLGGASDVVSGKGHGRPAYRQKAGAEICLTC